MDKHDRRVNVPVTENEEAAWKAAAHARGISLAEFVRQATNSLVRRDPAVNQAMQPPVNTPRPLHSGLSGFSPPLRQAEATYPQKTQAQPASTVQPHDHPTGADAGPVEPLCPHGRPIGRYCPLCKP